MKNLLGSFRISACLLASLVSLSSCGTPDSQSTDPIVTGKICAMDSDCASGQVCGFPLASGCTAQGVCLIYGSPGMAHCNSIILECGCAGNKVGVPCDYPNGYAPAPIKSMSSLSCP
jgi:hypothetical protein